ncbi:MULTISPECIES: AAA family ATPase [unclassified Rhodococcus (in: high G+C Gram-positive bacteria)]|uniref:AAA family ATPase n=1 Tax=unclassified Rhodococcus (in: high G+C Gram-positive bacteria) TaxID=192944 RepID=UPI000B9B907E|nr:MULTISPECIES: AAA family ATPase [unclassified Rhodococcus (in: high G+C Gram-positive bacteria)]OZE35649.1 hypothetical protein CH259_16630 [Rhodococcus sp. 05-2254-4]OZE48078.1 hypothetical protein CH261_09225 [Rhodococcus sp. 05-2254-3]OZE49289.1 hypothetical protein CH283_17010 [Rhodococcus sp. 05-2254-2]
MTLQTRPPTGSVPYPLIMLEGEEKAGKSWAIAELSASDKVSRTLWLDLGEGAGDEYGAIDGARYEVIVHDGRWSTIIGQIRDARDLAQQYHDEGKPPVVLAIDSVTAEWEMQKEWVDAKARRREKNSKILDKNPDAEIQITSDLWNLANARHKDMMLILKRFPGIVVITAQGAEVAVMDKAGNPTKDKTWKVDAQKKTPFDCSVWVRMFRTEHPRIVGARSVHMGIKPGEDKPKIVPDLTLEKLIFEMLKCDPASAHVRDLQSGVTAEEVFRVARAADSKESVNSTWKLAFEEDMLDESDGSQTVREVLLERAAAIKAESQPEAVPEAAAEESAQDTSTPAGEARAALEKSLKFKGIAWGDAVNKFLSDTGTDLETTEDHVAINALTQHYRGVK